MWLVLDCSFNCVEGNYRSIDVLGVIAIVVIAILQMVVTVAVMAMSS